MRITLIAALVVGLIPGVAFAHGTHSHAESPKVDIGSPGTAAQAKRTVTVIATDNDFSPKSITVAAGETVRFIVRNEGRFVHEMTIGTKAMQIEHQEEMLGLMVSGVIDVDRIDREKLGRHDHGNNVLLEPGAQGEIIWTFGKAAELEFGCNVPGHYEAGMKGDFRIN